MKPILSLITPPPKSPWNTLFEKKSVQKSVIHRSNIESYDSTMKSQTHVRAGLCRLLRSVWSRVPAVVAFFKKSDINKEVFTPLEKVTMSSPDNPSFNGSQDNSDYWSDEENFTLEQCFAVAVYKVYGINSDLVSLFDGTANYFEKLAVANTIKYAGDDFLKRFPMYDELKTQIGGSPEDQSYHLDDFTKLAGRYSELTPEEVAKFKQVEQNVLRIISEEATKN